MMSRSWDTIQTKTKFYIHQDLLQVFKSKLLFSLTDILSVEPYCFPDKSLVLGGHAETGHWAQKKGPEVNKYRQLTHSSSINVKDKCHYLKY